jgi:hypothetical protein
VARMTSDKKTLLEEANTWAKRNLISVGGCSDTPVHGVCRMLEEFCRRDMDAGVKKDIWSVMEDFSKTPGGKDLSKMKAQYEMFVDVVVSKQVKV